STGVASTILSLVPIFLIPFAVILHNEHVSYRGIFGAITAICGVLLLIY
ncbi:MAG: EamA family transporter, partial [bacterium]|nr:EamA family transporter [bacterium]